MSKQKRCRMAAIFDLITTERDYVGDLKVIIEVFKKPMLEERVAAPRVVNFIFSNE
ncbi:hypothetical protein DFS34DRAFT_694218 [Phlyctochytrium arcticum]|nr:hypothetical protein DFS34DRAFT_694218 [Phlyctochytrium arcticum]